jgi:hypothetical protein
MEEMRCDLEEEEKYPSALLATLHSMYPWKT